MIVWLASYPRSGNTLSVHILKRCFDLDVYSVYQKPLSDEDRAAHRPAEIRFFPDKTVEAFLERARSEENIYLVKTHEAEPPDNDDRAIYIIRDGRAALPSYRRFLKNYHQVELSLDDLIDGKNWPGLWNTHVERWLEMSSDETLFLRYEQLRETPPVEEIGEFLGMSPIRPFDMTFEEFHRQDPTFFGIGRDKPGIAEVEECCSQHFWTVNGDLMRRLGYGA